MKDIESRELIWALGSCCALHGKPFDPELLLKQYAPPYSAATFITSARTLGFQAQMLGIAASELKGISTTAILIINFKVGQGALGLLVSANAESITWIAGTPLLLLPRSLEQVIVAKRIRAVGAASLMSLDEAGALAHGVIRAFFNNSGADKAAKIFAKRYAGCTQQNVIEKIVDAVDTVFSSQFSQPRSSLQSAICSNDTRQKL